MTDEHTRQIEAIFGALNRHPRVAHQQIAATAAQVDQLKAAMPFLSPYAARGFHDFIIILDWDHKLPSKVAILRLYGYYSELTHRAGVAEFLTKSEQIDALDKFPEFDVPDFAGLTADEAYEAEVDPAGQMQQIRLVSNWRRDIKSADARVAVQVTRKSEEFKQIVAKNKRRPDYLGDLEAVSWTPPCESAHTSWTIDVWYLMDLDASMGKGRSFLVDLKTKTVVGVREFVVRSS